MPLVSVIVPNYNHGRFLRQRLESIVAQTFDDFELILMDDASTDESVDVLTRFAERDSARLLLNKQNSGNPFRQWNRGFREATGKYMWIAESDDYADERFLETLVAIMEQHPSVGVAYCESWVVDDENRVLSSMQEGYIKDLSPDRWASAFVNSGRHECGRWMVLKNAIPNASAALVRRDVFEAVGGADESMKLCGDWSTWVRILLASDVAFTPEHLNYFRTHNASVRHRTVATPVFVQESYRIARQIIHEVDVDPQVREWVSASLMNRWGEFLKRFQLSDVRTHAAIFRDGSRVDPWFFGRLRNKIGELRRRASPADLRDSLRY